MTIQRACPMPAAWVGIIALMAWIAPLTAPQTAAADEEPIDAAINEPEKNLQPIIADQMPPTIRKGKEPAVALAFSLILTGTGQVYNGEYLKGIAMFGAVVGGAALIGAAS